MAYERVNWENSPSTATPLNATNLNKMDAGIANLDEGVADLNAKFGGDGILDISKGGTGNSVGYIQTGYKALSVRGSKVTIEGNNNEASADYAHAEGSNNTASRSNAHVEGRYNVASGTSSHAEGESNIASGNYSHAGGRGNTAGYEAQTVVGKYNDNKSDTLFEVGGGTNDNNRKNAFEVSADGISTDNGNTKIRFGKNESNQYGYYREDDPNLILFDSSIASCAGIGKKTGVNSSGVIDTDIILGRNPEKGDRFLVYFDSKVDNANSMKIYVTSGSFVTPSLFEGGLIPLEYYLNGLCLFEYKVDNILSSYYLDLIYRKEDLIYTAGTGISIQNNQISNTAPQLGVNVTSADVDEVVDGYLGIFSGTSKLLMLHFMASAQPDEDNGYVMMLSYGARMDFAQLIDGIFSDPYTKKIYADTTLVCMVTDNGSGTEQNPKQVVVLGIIGDYVTAGWDHMNALGDRATAEGAETDASGNQSHAGGYQTTASGNQSVAMGYNTTASNDNAVALGNGTTASGGNAVASGYNTVASGPVSTAMGTNTQATQQAQVAMGKYNAANNDALLMIGNGASGARSNALEVMLNGDVKAGNDVIDGQGNTLSVLAEALTKTASGNPIIINAQDVAAKALTVEIGPKQSLHGYDKPWAGGSGKNKLNVTATTQTVSGVTFTVNSDGTVTANGTASAQITLNLTNGFISFPSGNYVINGGVNTNIRVYANPDKTQGYYSGSADSPAFNVSTELVARIQIENGTVCNNVLIKPMIRLSTESDASFAPYSNICPISGYDSVSVDDHGKNFVDIDNAINFEKYSGGIRNGFEFSDCKGTYTISQSVTVSNIFFAYQTAGGTWTEASLSSSTLSATLSNVDGKIQIWVASGETIKSKSPYLQLELGSTATTFEPYTGQTITIALGQTVYGGTLDFDSGNLLITHYRYVIDGSVGEFSSTNNRYIIRTNEVNIPNAIDAFDNLNCVCDKFETITNRQGAMQDGKGVYASGTIIAICGFKNSKSDYVTWLANNPVEVCYELATPTTLQLTPAQLELLKGYNYITGDGEMQLVYIPESILPTAPTTDGTYRLICTVSNGVPSFSWAAN